MKTEKHHIRTNIWEKACPLNIHQTEDTGKSIWRQHSRWVDHIPCPNISHLLDESLTAEQRSHVWKISQTTTGLTKSIRRTTSNSSQEHDTGTFEPEERSETNVLWELNVEELERTGKSAILPQYLCLVVLFKYFNILKSRYVSLCLNQEKI